MESVSSVGKRIQRKDTDWFDLESLEGVVDTIFSWLPVKCLLNVKAVSKFFHELVRSQPFIKLHLRITRENAFYILFPFMPVNRNIYIIDADAGITETITLPDDENLSHYSIICSYNGLVCLTNFPVVHFSYISKGGVVAGLEILICNPATCEVYVLPKCSPSDEDLGIGVGGGPEISEYKVFRFFRSKSNSEIALPDPQVFLYSLSGPKSNSEAVPPLVCEIYSSRTRTWRCIGPVQHCPMGAHHVFVNGKVYWFIPSEENHDIPGSILSVDVEEHFEVISLPDALTEVSFLIDFNGCLSIVAVDDKDDPVVIWILKNENEFVWEKKCCADIPYGGMMEDLHSVAAREHDIFFITAHHYIILDTDDSSWCLIDFDVCEPNAHAVFPYTQSLLPCSGHFARKENDQ